MTSRNSLLAIVAMCVATVFLLLSTLAPRDTPALRKLSNDLPALVKEVHRLQASEASKEEKISLLTKSISDLQRQVNDLQSNAHQHGSAFARNALPSPPSKGVGEEEEIPGGDEANVGGGKWRYDKVDTTSKNVVKVPEGWKDGPYLAHKFNSGVMIWRHMLRGAQKERFEEHNVWEVVDEGLISKVLRHANSNDLFLDCGAALGYYSLLARHMSKEIEIHSFNPHPTFVKRMQQNLILNGFDDVTIHPVAIADKPMKGVKMTSAGFGGRVQENKNGTINAITLNDFYRENLKGTGKRILLVKADVEGFELKMLSAATELFGVVQNWVIAIHQTRQACGELLKQNGYTIIHEDPERVPGEPNGVLVATLNKDLYFPGTQDDN